MGGGRPNIPCQFTQKKLFYKYKKEEEKGPEKKTLYLSELKMHKCKSKPKQAETANIGSVAIERKIPPSTSVSDCRELKTLPELKLFPCPFFLTVRQSDRSPSPPASDGNRSAAGPDAGGWFRPLAFSGTYVSLRPSVFLPCHSDFHQLKKKKKSFYHLLCHNIWSPGPDLPNICPRAKQSAAEHIQKRRD